MPLAAASVRLVCFLHFSSALRSQNHVNAIVSKMLLTNTHGRGRCASEPPPGIPIARGPLMSEIANSVSTRSAPRLGGETRSRRRWVVVGLPAILLVAGAVWLATHG